MGVRCPYSSDGPALRRSDAQCAAFALSIPLKKYPFSPSIAEFLANREIRSEQADTRLRRERARWESDSRSQGRGEEGKCRASANGVMLSVHRSLVYSGLLRPRSRINLTWLKSDPDGFCYTEFAVELTILSAPGKNWVIGM